MRYSDEQKAILNEMTPGQFAQFQELNDEQRIKFIDNLIAKKEADSASTNEEGTNETANGEQGVDADSASTNEEGTNETANGEQGINEQNTERRKLYRNPALNK